MRKSRQLCWMMFAAICLLAMSDDLLAAAVGDRGEAVWRDGKYAPAGIVKIEGSLCLVRWDKDAGSKDPHEFWQACENFIPQGTKPPPVGECAPPAKGSEVMINKGGKWLHAVVLGNMEGNLNVRYDDLKTETVHNFRWPEFCPKKGVAANPPPAAVDPELAAAFTMNEVKPAPVIPRENAVANPDGSFKAFTSVDRLFVEDTKAAKLYEIKIEGLPRPFSNLKWSGTILSFDRWPQPGYKLQFSVDVARKSVTKATASFE